MAWPVDRFAGFCVAVKLSFTAQRCYGRLHGLDLTGLILAALSSPSPRSISLLIIHDGASSRHRFLNLLISIITTAVFDLIRPGLDVKGPPFRTRTSSVPRTPYPPRRWPTTCRRKGNSCITAQCPPRTLHGLEGWLPRLCSQGSPTRKNSLEATVAPSESSTVVKKLIWSIPGWCMVHERLKSTSFPVT